MVVDRTHVDAEQRAYFVAIAREAGVPAHALLLLPPLQLMQQRVRERTDHKVAGELQVTSYKLKVTSYKLQVTSYKLQVASYKLQAYKFQVSSYSGSSSF